MGKREDRRIPPAQRSPYGRPPAPKKDDTMAFFDEWNAEQERNIQETIAATGICDCEDCRRTRGEDMSGDAYDRLRKRIQEELSASFGLPSHYLFGADWDDGQVRDSKSALQQAEEKAREPVAKFLHKSSAQMSWDDIAGNEEALAAMREAIEFPKKHAELYAFYDKKPTKGILLKGPPGCGKTMIGRAAASVIAQLNGINEASMLNIKATELQTPYVGETEKLIRKIFAYAKAYKALHGHQLTIFIDEADAILPDRNGRYRQVYGFEESQVATFLTEMDGLEESAALVILATNRPEAIDAAILRDGRIDRRITVKRPTIEAATLIFKRAMARVPVHGLAIDDIVARAMDSLFDPTRHLLRVKSERGIDYLTMGHIVSGAMMVGLAERAKACAMTRDIASGRRTGVTMHDIAQVIESVVQDARTTPDMYALREFAEVLGTPMLEVDRVKPEIKFNALN